MTWAETLKCDIFDNCIAQHISGKHRILAIHSIIATTRSLNKISFRSDTVNVDCQSLILCTLLAWESVRINLQAATSLKGAVTSSLTLIWAKGGYYF